MTQVRAGQGTPARQKQTRTALEIVPDETSHNVKVPWRAPTAILFCPYYTAPEHNSQDTLTAQFHMLGRESIFQTALKKAFTRSLPSQDTLTILEAH